MTDNNHPITPPPELVEQWLSKRSVTSTALATQAARWGADQELEACCKLLELSDSNARDFLYSARRPKPPSLKELKEQALAELNLTADPDGAELSRTQVELIRLALESLPDL